MATPAYVVERINQIGPMNSLWSVVHTNTTASIDNADFLASYAPQMRPGDWILASKIDDLAKRALQAAVRREADITVVTPGQEKPLWLSSHLGSVIGQVRTFNLVTIQRTLIAGLQDLDAAKVVAAAGMIGLGMLSEQLKLIVHGKEHKNPPKDIGDWMYVGLANSGLLGWLTDADQMVDKVTRGSFSVGRQVFGNDRPISRFASQSVFSALAGPSFGQGADIAQSIGAFASRNFSESDVHAIRRLAPYQNLWFLSRALRNFEDGMIDRFGVPRTQQRN